MAQESRSELSTNQNVIVIFCIIILCVQINLLYKDL